MKFKELKKKLNKVLHTKQGQKLDQIDSIEGLLAKLKEKKAKLLDRQPGIEDEKESAKIERKIKTYAAQILKGTEALKLLKQDAKEPA